MARIVFNVFPHSAHFGSTFALAKYLEEIGHKVYYVSDIAGYERLVTSRGFAFYLVTHDKDFNHPLESLFNLIFLFWKAEPLNKYIDEFKYVRSVHNIATCSSLFDKMINDLCPDLLMIDNDLPFSALHLVNYNKPCAIFHPHLPREMANHRPAMGCGYPFADVIANIRTATSWKSYLLIRDIKRIYHWLRYFGTEQYYLARSIRNEKNDRRMRIDGRKNFNFQSESIPEVNLSPIDMDLPRPVNKQQIYIGHLFTRDEAEVSDYQFPNKMIKLREKVSTDGTPVVFCSISSRLIGSIKDSNQFITRIVNAFKSINCELILEVGTTIDPCSLSDVRPNIHIFQSVRRKELYEWVDVVITHGEIDVLMECVLHEIPIFVFPLPSNWVHTGNSTRVVYHGIGLRGDIEKESKEKIQSKVSALLKKPEFKINLKELNRKIAARSETVSISNIFDSLLKANPKQPC